MTGYIANILGVVIMSVMIEIILPNGTMAKYIKSIFAVFVIFVLISPLAQLKDKINLGKYLQYEDYTVDASLVSSINERKVVALQFDIENALEKGEIINADVIINFETTNNEILIQNVCVDLSKAILNKDFKHINKYAYMNDIVLRYVSVEEKDIMYYE